MAEFNFPVEASHILMFARAIRDSNPAYQTAISQDKKEGIAPPTFALACAHFDPDYYFRPKPGEKWFGSGKAASGLDGKPASSGSLHAEQHFVFHRHLRPGEVVTVETRTGTTWDKQSAKHGTLKFRDSVTEFRDPNGDLVVTARSVNVRTQGPVDPAKE